MPGSGRPGQWLGVPDGAPDTLVSSSSRSYATSPSMAACQPAAARGAGCSACPRWSRADVSLSSGERDADRPRPAAPCNRQSAAGHSSDSGITSPAACEFTAPAGPRALGAHDRVWQAPSWRGSSRSVRKLHTSSGQPRGLTAVGQHSAPRHHAVPRSAYSPPTASKRWRGGPQKAVSDPPCAHERTQSSKKSESTSRLWQLLLGQ